MNDGYRMNCKCRMNNYYRSMNGDYQTKYKCQVNLHMCNQITVVPNET